MDDVFDATEPIFEIEIQTTEELKDDDILETEDTQNKNRENANENDNNTSANVEEDDQDLTLEVFRRTGSNADESLAVLSNTSLYGDIYEMEMSDMEISDSETPRKNIKTTQEKVTSSQKARNKKLTDDAPQLSGREEGELSPEPHPAHTNKAEPENNMKVPPVQSNTEKSLPAIQEYYERLGKIFAEAKKMSQEIRKGFSQLFTEDQLKALENQVNDISPQQIKNLQLKDVTNTNDLKNRRRSPSKNRRRSRSRSRYRQSSRYHRSYVRRRSRSYHRSNRTGSRPRRSGSRPRRSGSGPRHDRRKSTDRKQPIVLGKLRSDEILEKSKSGDKKAESSRRSSTPTKRSGQDKSKGANDKQQAFLHDSSRDNRESKPFPAIDRREKQRAKTLVSRQMKLISQHMENANAKPIPPGVIRTQQDLDKSPERSDDFKDAPYRPKISKPSDIKTLQDFEIFLDNLKERNREKILNDKDVSARLKRLKYEGTMHKDWLPLIESLHKVGERDSSVESEFRRRIQYIDEDKQKGLYFNSSKKFKDTFKEHDNKNEHSRSYNRGDNYKTKSTTDDKKKIARTPVKFEMKGNRNTKTKPASSLFSDTSSSLSTSASDISKKSNKDTQHRYREDTRSAERNTREQENIQKTRRKEERSDSRTRIRRSSVESRGKANRKQNSTELPKELLKDRKPLQDVNKWLDANHSRKRISENSINDDPINRKISKVNDSKEQRNNLVPDDKSLKENLKVKISKLQKKIIVLGKQEDLKKVVITPELRQLMLNNKLKQSILIKVVKTKDKLETHVVNNSDDYEIVAKDPKPKSDMSLKQLEAFMKDLREKKKSETEKVSQIHLEVPEHVRKESRFLDRHRLKRKAKLMACVGIKDRVPNKEAKLLESMKKMNGDQEQFEKSQALKRFKAENESIMQTTNKPPSNQEKIYKALTQSTLPEKAQIEDGNDGEPKSTTPPPQNDNEVEQTEKKKDLISSKEQNLLNRVKKKVPTGELKKSTQQNPKLTKSQDIKD